MNTLRSFDVWARAIHPDDRERMMAAARRRQERVPGGIPVVDPEGTVRHYLDYGAPQRDGRWIGAFRDITKASRPKTPWRGWPPSCNVPETRFCRRTWRASSRPGTRRRRNSTGIPLPKWWAASALNLATRLTGA